MSEFNDPAWPSAPHSMPFPFHPGDQSAVLNLLVTSDGGVGVAGWSPTCWPLLPPTLACTCEPQDVCVRAWAAVASPLILKGAFVHIF